MDYQWIDADGHYYEPDDCFTRHIEQKYKDATVRVDRSRGDGLGRIYVGGKRTFMSIMPGDYASAPGAKLGLFSGKQDDGFAHKEVINAKDHPAFTDKNARLKFLDAQNLEATLMLPTLAVAVEEDLAHDVELTYASLRAFNRWLEDDWTYGQGGRLYGVPMLSLLSLDHAMLELDRVLKAGAKLVHLRPGPVGNQSPAHPMFDKFWSTVNEAGVGVVFHVSNSGYNRAFGTLWSENPLNPSHNQSPLQWALCNTERPIVDTMIAITLHNLFGRHPGIKIISIENGSGWLKSVCKTVDKAAALGRQGPQIGGELPTKPSEALLQHLYISPFPEDDITELLGLLGPDRVLFGSDYPHPEGLRLPQDYLELIAGQNATTQRKVLRGNTAKLIGLEAAAV
jgi:predicted TIM-barrel fold metal-dependent hydrolase